MPPLSDATTRMLMVKQHMRGDIVIAGADEDTGVDTVVRLVDMLWATRARFVSSTAAVRSKLKLVIVVSVFLKP